MKFGVERANQIWIQARDSAAWNRLRHVPGVIGHDRRSLLLRFPKDIGYLHELYEAAPLQLDTEVHCWAITQEQRTRQLLNIAKQKYSATVNEQTVRTGELRPFQTVGVEFLAAAQRAMLCDEPGLGKTIQSIAAADRLGAKKILVVGLGALRWKWADEVARFSHGTTLIVEGAAVKRTDLLQTPHRWAFVTYATLRLDTHLLIAQQYDLIVFDEAHRLKDRRSQQSEAAARLSAKTKHVFLLTATPVRNQVNEYFGLLRVLDQARFTSYWRFVHTFCATEISRYGHQVIIGPKNIRWLHETLLGFVLQRKYEDVFEEPPEITTETVKIPLTAPQRKVYALAEREAILETVDGDKIISNPLEKLIRLRQILGCPEVLGLSIKSERVTTAVELARNLLDQGRSVVMFTWFVATALGVKAGLEKSKAPTYLITGQLSAHERSEAATKFQESAKPAAIIGTIKSMGEGLDLDRASDVILVEKDWVPDVNFQAASRLRRLSHLHPVRSYEIITTNTVDEDVEHVLETKREIISETALSRAVILRMAGRAS